MNLLKKLFRRDDVSKRSSSIDGMSFGMWMTDCGLPSGYRRFVDCPEVQMAVNVYARLISSMTIHLMKNTDLGDVRVTNMLSRLIDIEPNPEMTKRTFYEHLIRTLLLHGEGNQVTVPVIKDGLIEKLVPLDPYKVGFDDASRTIIYDSRIAYTNDEVLHFVFNPHEQQPWRGSGLKATLQSAVDSMEQADRTKREIFKSPHPSLIVKIDAMVDELKGGKNREKLAIKYEESMKSGRPWFVPGAGYVEVEQIKPVTINDLAIRDGLELDKRKIAAMFGVPPFLVGVDSFDSAEFNNFVRTQLMPIAKTIEQELTRKLLLADDWYFRFNSNSLFAYSLPEKIDAGSRMTAQLAMSRNEWRDWIGFSPRRDMEELIVLENYIPADMIGDQKKLKGQGKDEPEE